MKNDLRLFIGGNEIELGASPSILYTYTVDDLQNPTVVKNSFSKTITIDGTQQNNTVFGQYWNVEKLVSGAGTGVDYNASKKVDFEILVNGEIYESGYVKLEKINNLNGRYTYDVSLFGGLGDYFYSLSYNPNTGGKLKLSDLDYTEDGGSSEFDFVATATTIVEAWDSLKEGSDDKWQHINFVPAYNGYPEDFDTDKVIINLSGTSLPATDPDNIFLPQSGCVIANLPQEMTEWEMRDLRSYCQRPAIRMRSIIDACANPDQNGGYTVDLDPDFFNDDNPYYDKTWVTLPLLKNLEYTNDEQVLEGANLIGITTTGSVEGMMYQDLKFDIGDYSNSTPSTIGMRARIFVNNPLSQLNAEINPFIAALSTITAPYTSFMLFWRPHGNKVRDKWDHRGSMFVQMIALNGEVVVGASDAYNLTTPVEHNGREYIGDNSVYPSQYQFKPYLNKNITNVRGEFHDNGFCKFKTNTPWDLDFTIRGINGPVSQLKMVYFFGATEAKVKKYGRATFYGETTENAFGDGDFFDWSPDCTIDYKNPYEFTVGVTQTDFKAVLGASLGRTGTKVDKSLLLNTEGSPCDYLLSYCKMFGLYFRKEVDSKTIHIETRKTFYKRDEVVDLNDYIDRGKDIKINPLAFTTKWYEMVQEQDDSQFYEKYMTAHGIEYGSKLLDTGYEFNVEKKKLYEGNILRSGIEGLERSKFFSAFNDDARQRSWMGMGLKYNLSFGGIGNVEINVPVRNNSDLLGINEGEGMKYYDVFPKLQFHEAENDPTDGNNVLVFFSGFKSVTSGRSNPLRYYISDDNMYQTLLNDSTPCWLFTAEDFIGDRQFVHTISELPVFERYYTDVNSGKVNKSLDFGTAQELFIPDYNITEEQNIYSNYWRTYIEDLFDPNTKIMTCYVVANGKVNGDWLRRFYWFDNAIWRLNRITDWNLADFGPTQMEFVKVQNIGNYTTPTQTNATSVNITASSYRVGNEGGTVTLNITISSGGAWRLTTTGGAVLSTTTGTGNTTLTATIPANSDTELKGYYFTVSSMDGAQARCTIMQGYEGETDFYPSQSHLIFPSSGGNAIVDLIWKNQGTWNIDDIDYDEDDDALAFSVDRTSLKENRITFTISSYTGTSVISNYCTLISNSGHTELRKTVIIDQIPESLSFNPTGSTESLTLSSSGASVSGLPYWVTAVVSGTEVTFTAISNPSSDPRTGTGTISYPDGSKATITFNQEGNTGGGGSGSTFEVSPLSIYFGQEGGTQYVYVTSDGPWYLTLNSNRFTTSIQNGTGNAVIGVTVESGSSYWSDIFFVQQPNGGSKTVSVSQGNSADTGVTFTVSPETTTVATTGETVSYFVDTNSINSYLTVVAYAGSVQGVVGQIQKVGLDYTVDITYPANDTLDGRAWTVVFTLYNGTTPIATKTLYPTQAESDVEYFRSNTTFNHPASGKTDSFVPDTNTCWYSELSSVPVDDYIYPMPIVEAIGFETPSWNINNLIDTGIHQSSGVTMRVKYIGRDVLSDRIMGTIEGYGPCTDDSDFRLFDIFAGTLYLDVMDNRWGGGLRNLSADEQEYDITIGNTFIYDNIEEALYIDRPSAEFWNSACTLCVDVGSRWVKEVIIEESGVTLFHGTAYSEGGVVGLYDEISDSVFTLYSGSSGTLITRTVEPQPVPIPTWLTATTSGCSGDSFAITTSFNTENSSRTAYVNIYSNNTHELLKSMKINQAGGGITLSVSPSALVFDSTGGTATFTITTNYNWTIE